MSVCLVHCNGLASYPGLLSGALECPPDQLKKVMITIINN